MRAFRTVSGDGGVQHAPPRAERFAGPGLFPRFAHFGLHNATPGRAELSTRALWHHSSTLS
jgi:hypothetical protein